MMLSILETPVELPEPSIRYIVEENRPCGWRILAICDSESEAVEIYDRLNSEVSQ